MSKRIRRENIPLLIFLLLLRKYSKLCQKNTENLNQHFDNFKKLQENLQKSLESIKS